MKKLVAGILVLLAGCTTTPVNVVKTEVIPIADSHYYPATDHVDVLFGELPESGSYQQLAYIQVTGGPDTRLTELVNRMKMKARMMGADAVVDLKTSSVLRNADDGGDSQSTASDDDNTGTAILAVGVVAAIVALVAAAGDDDSDKKGKRHHHHDDDDDYFSIGDSRDEDDRYSATVLKGIAIKYLAPAS